MKKTVKFACIYLCFTLSSFLPQAFAQHKIALLYNNDSTAALLYEGLLKSYGFEITLVDQPRIAKFDFTSFNLILAGPKSGASWTGWNNPGAVGAIKASGKRILVLGQAASGLFKDMNLWNNGGNAGTSLSLPKWKVLNPTDSIFNYPLSVALNQDGTFSPVINETVGDYLYIGANVPKSAVYYFTSERSDLYSALASDSGKFYFYGQIVSTLSDFTQAGKDFFINLVYKAGAFSGALTAAQPSQMESAAFSMYPNPGSGLLHVESKFNFAKIEIFSSSQGMVYVSNDVFDVINLTHLSPGLYLAKAFTADGSSFITKIVLQK